VVREYPLAFIAGGWCYPKHCLLSLSHAKSPLHHALFWRGLLYCWSLSVLMGLLWFGGHVLYGMGISSLGALGPTLGGLSVCLFWSSQQVSWICHRGVETSDERSNRASARRNGNSLRCRFHFFQSTTLTDAQGQCLALAPVRSVLARSGILAATLRRYSAGLSFVKR